VNSPIRRPLIGVAIACVVALVAATPFAARRAGADKGQGARSPAHAACDPGNGGLSLPDGFCATIFADNLGSVRHMTVTPKGDLIVALESSGKNPNARGTGALILRDTSGKGKADVQRLIPAGAGTGIAWRDGWLYLDEQSRITRYKLPAGALDREGVRPGRQACDGERLVLAAVALAPAQRSERSSIDRNRHAPPDRAAQ